MKNLILACLMGAAFLAITVIGGRAMAPAAPPEPSIAQVETFSCVRVKHVADGGVIEYRCEVRK